jgi:molybdate transport system regulatory protein
MSLRLRCKVWLENDSGKPVMGEGRLRILNAVRVTGSISKAARKLNLPFRKVWAKIKDAERQAGFKIVETTKSGSRLTPEGEDFLLRFAQFQTSCQRSAHTKFRKQFAEAIGEPVSTEHKGECGRKPDC